MMQQISLNNNKSQKYMAVNALQNQKEKPMLQLNIVALAYCYA